jgi:hypothetical protein
VGYCPCCGARTQGRHPLQTSDALGAAKVQIGPEALVLGAHLNKQMGLSLVAGAESAFVAKLDTSGNVLFATYLGGSGSDHGLFEANAADHPHFDRKE